MPNLKKLEAACRAMMAADWQYNSYLTNTKVPTPCVVCSLCEGHAAQLEDISHAPDCPIGIIKAALEDEENSK